MPMGEELVDDPVQQPVDNPISQAHTCKVCAALESDDDRTDEQSGNSNDVGTRDHKVSMRAAWDCVHNMFAAHIKYT